MRKIILLFLLLGILIPFTNSQQLSTKCPSSDWTQYYEKCYLAVNYTLTWSDAYDYCKKYGAKLVEPRGYDLHDAIRGEVNSKMPTVSSYWTGFHRRTDDSNLPAYSGFWSDGQPAGVEVGVWGLREPDVTAGNCAYVNRVNSVNGQWHMTSCDNLMSFLCETDPCPADDRDTFMCNGRCLGQGYVCDGHDDCGNNYDEQNCASSCSQIVTSNSGTITFPTSNGQYSPNQQCSWLIETTPGTRINMTIESLKTELNTDFLDIYDGGFSMSTSALSARLSGNMTNYYYYKSSRNFIYLRFVSDQSTQDSGFRLSWTTAYTCGYSELMNYNLTNTDVIDKNNTLALSTLSSYVKCQAECNDRTDCVGFSYDSVGRICYFMDMLPVLEAVSGSIIYTKACPSYGTVKGSIPEWDNMLTAGPSYQQLATPLYPNNYIQSIQEFKISASANNRITLEVLYVDLCCGDMVTIHDEDRSLLYTLNADSVPMTLISRSSGMIVRMDLHTPGKCRGVLTRYIEGCDISITGSGQFMSPGYGSINGYGPVTLCTWTLYARDENSGVSVLFEDFSLHSTDVVMLTNSSHSVTYTNQELDGATITSPTTLVVTMETSARDSGSGFIASSSAGCSSLDSGGYSISSGSNNYGDTVTLQCAQGYLFIDEYADQTAVTMSCGIGGIWSLDPIPVCQRSHCGPPPLITNGYIVSSSGSQGGDITEYECRDGFNITGSDIIRCLANGSWEARPVCTAASCADLNTTLADPVQWTALYGDGINPNSVVRLSCPAHMAVRGAATVSCQGGAWGFTPDADPSFCQAVPCKTPVIDGAFLAPAPPYDQNMMISVDCIEGYDLNGADTFRCGVDTDLPTCVKKTCSLAGFTDIVPVNDNRTVYNYGERVMVACASDLVLATRAYTECLANGNWSIRPECRNASCGLPYQVAGSVYIPETPCLEYGCSFQFTCESKYERFGISDFGDYIIRCGYNYTGLWGFGNLHCLGGQCSDPGYPPGGFLIGDSFQEGAAVAFGCHKAGFSTLNSDGSASSGLVCNRDPVTGNLVWTGEMPTCNDTQKPVFTNCPTQDVTIGYLEAPGFLVPTVFDNNAVRDFDIIPANFDPTVFRTNRLDVYYRARDYVGNTMICPINIEILDFIECHNDVTTAYPLDSDLTLYGNDSSFFEQVTFGSNISVTSVPPSITVLANVETLQNIYEIEVTAINTTSNVLLDKCTIQFRFEAPECASWSLYVPNGFGNCVNGECNTSCNNGSYFMENPTANNILVTCTASGWNRDPPVCASSTTSYVIYTAVYNFKYIIFEGVDDFSACATHYRAEVESILEAFAGEMETDCNANSDGNEAVVTFLDIIGFEYSNADLRLKVRFEFQINVTHENLTDSQELKDQCANIIQSTLSNPSYVDGEPLFRLQGNNQCGNGTYDYPSSTASFSYRCVGNRKFVNINSSRLCLNCPTGFYYNVLSENCEKCPRNKYGKQTDLGAVCEACPNGNGPDRTGLTDVDHCYWKARCGPGYYSEDGMAPCTICPRNFYNPQNTSRTCQKCGETQITLEEGSISSANCTTQSVAENIVATQPEFFGIPTPCLPNPCQNNANCSYLYNTYYCSCTDGYTGRLCDQLFTACHSDPCQNEQQCVPLGNGDFTCNCGQADSEFTGDLCEIDQSDLDPGLCLNNGTVHNRKGGHTCMCPSYAGYSNDNTGNCGTAIDQCTANECVQGECITHGSFYRSCHCYPGFTGLDCDQNIDDCDPNLCENKGNCTDLVGSFTCQCPDGYHGDYCQFVTACDTACSNGTESGCNTCDMTGTDTCENIGNSFMCHCKTNYIGIACEIELSPCNSYPCQHAGTCVEVTAVDYTCTCEEPWTGTHCETEINNCGAGSECLNGGTCYSSAGGFVCSCPSDYIGSTCSEVYDLCERANPCVSSQSNCSFSGSSFTCVCDPDHTGDSCQTPVLSCANNVCNNGGTCDDTSGTPSCVCVDGFTGSTCDTNVNECASNPCANDEECQDGVNLFTCTCGVTRRGENCDKEVDANFDYIIMPSTLCREDASLSSFGDGATNIEAMTISFWTRYTALHGTGTVLSVYATSGGGTLIPQSPDLQIIFDSTHMVAEYTSPNRRKKRQAESSDFSYPTSIADGYWWHIALVWASDPGELTLYINGTFIDQEFFATGSSLGTRGYVVLGKFNTQTGTVDVSNSFEGRTSQLYVVNEALGSTAIQQLFARTLVPNNLLLYPQRTTMLYYPVDYTSQLNLANGNCLSRTDSTCDINAVTSFPEILICPGDVLSVTARLEAPTWTAPTFSANASYISTMSSGTLIEWGLYGVSYAVLDSQNNADVCTFRVYNREVGCSASAGNANCTTDSSTGVHRCEDTCTGNQEWTGVVPLFLTCSMYGMWDEAVKTSPYIQPECSTASDITNDVSMTISGTTSEACDLMRDDYISSIQTKLNTFNTQTGSQLCTQNCNSLVTSSSVICLDSSTVQVSLDFGIISSTLTFQGAQVTVKEALQIAAGDSQVFAYASTSNSNQIIDTDITSLDITATPSCGSQAQISGNKCVTCGPGTSYNETTSTCVRCPIGTYKDSLVTSCTACHSSRTTGSDGATSSDYCKASCFTGQYYDELDLQGCRDCPIGFYQDIRGQFSCKPCLVTYTTVTAGSQSSNSCVTIASLSTTSSTQIPSGGASAQASTEDTGLDTGVIVAIVLGVLIGLLIIVLILVFCCCKGAFPCLSKKKQVVSPVVKDGYYANKYGELDMRFVSYNLKDVREKKGRSLDREPIVEPALSEETGSLKTDISIHVPVFTEKMNGGVTRKSLYVSNGGQNLNASLTRSLKSSTRDPVSSRDQMTPHIIAPMTSSPRSMSQYQYDEDTEEHKRRSRSKKKRRRGHKHRSGHHYDNEDETTHGHKHRSSHHYGNEDDATYGHKHRTSHHYDNQDDATYENVDYLKHHVPKALSPLPQKVKSKPPSDVFMRPASPMTRPRAEVLPSEYRDFLEPSPERSPGRSSGQRSQSQPPKAPKVYRLEDPSAPEGMMRIEVESDDEDLR